MTKMPSIVLILLIVYLFAINLYGIVILNYQKKSNLATINGIESENKISNFKLVLTGIMGGALGIFIFMFIFKYKLKSMFFMIIMPLIIALQVYLIILLTRSGVGYYTVNIKRSLSLQAVSILLQMQ